MTERRTIKFTSTLTKYSFKELNTELQALVKSSVKASETAFAPFSKFKVGASVLLENGEMVIGSNQENVAYPSGLCAERVALFACGAHFQGVSIKYLAVYVDSFNNPDEIPMPCGACRQVMNQSEVNQTHNFKILLVTKGLDVYEAENTEQLLPFPFKF